MTDEKIADVLSIVAALACVAIALMLFSGCQQRRIRACQFDATRCQPPPEHETDMPPIGLMRLHYKGCMRSCGRFSRFHAGMPQGECGADKADDCSYSPVWGEPNGVAPTLAEDEAWPR